MQSWVAEGTTNFLPAINLYGNCFVRGWVWRRWLINCLCFIRRSSEGRCLVYHAAPNTQLSSESALTHCVAYYSRQFTWSLFSIETNFVSARHGLVCATGRHSRYWNNSLPVSPSLLKAQTAHGVRIKEVMLFWLLLLNRACAVRVILTTLRQRKLF